MARRGLNCLYCRKHLWMEKTLSNMFSVPPVKIYWCSKCKTYFNIMDTATYSGESIIKAAIVRYYGPKYRPIVLSEMTAKERQSLKKLTDKAANMLSQWDKPTSPRRGQDLRIKPRRAVPPVTVVQK